MRIADALLDAEGRILPAAWADAVQTGLPVGSCHCGAPLLAAGESIGHRLAPRRFYEVACLMDGDHEGVVPAGKVLREFATAQPGAGIGPDRLRDAWRERDLAILGERD